jgi:hypothetical protein
MSMGEFLPPVVMELRATIGEFSAKMQEAKHELTSLEKAGASSGTRFATALKLGAMAGSAAVVAGLTIAVHEAQKLEEAQVRLKTALQGQKQPVEEVMAQVEALGGRFEKLGFSQTDVTDGFGRLELALQSPEKAMKLMGVTADYARFKHISLADSARIMARASQGSARAFKELGISMDKNIKDPQARAAAAFEELKKRLSGQSTAYTKTFAGQLTVIKTQFEALAEKIGMKVIPILSKILQYITDNIPKWEEWAGKLQPIGDFLVSVGKGLEKVANLLERNKNVLIPLTAAFVTWYTTMKIVSAVTTAYKAVQQAYAFYTYSQAASTGVLTAAMNALKIALLANPIGLIVAALVALGAGLIYAYKHSETFRKIVDNAFKVVKNAASSVLNFFKNNWKNILIFLTGPVGIAVALIVKHWDKIKELGSKALGWGKDIITGLINGIKNAIGSIKAIIGDVAHSVIDTFKSALGISSPSKVFDMFGQETINGYVKGLSKGKKKIYEAAKAAADAAKKALVDAKQELTDYKINIADSLTGGFDANATFKQNVQDATDAYKKAQDDARAKVQERGGTQEEEDRAARAVKPPAQASIMSTMRAQLEKLKQFSAGMKRLAKAGLNRSMFQQLLQAGPDALPAVNEILASGVGDFNKLQSEITQVSAELAGTGASNAGLTAKAATAQAKLNAANKRGQEIVLNQTTHLDGKVVHKSVQHHSLKHNRRNVANNLTIPHGAAL